MSKFKIIRAETGYSEMLNVGAKSYDTLENLEDFLSMANWRAKDQLTEKGLKGSCYKTDFVLTFENKVQYHGRYDLGTESNLRAHLRDIINMNSGAKKPAHFSDEEYSAYLKGIVGQYIDKWNDWRENYDFHINFDTGRIE